jgi:hypothetical protein
MAQTEFPEEFARWMLPALPDASPEVMSKRWVAVRDTATRAGDVPSDTLDIVRLLFGLPLAAENSEAQFRRSFVQRDPQFATTQNALEMRLLGGAVLAEIIRSKCTGAAIATLGVLSASACGSRVNDETRPFVELARQRRKHLAVRTENSGPWPALPGETAVRLRAANAGEALADEDVAEVARYVAYLGEFGHDVLEQLREQADISWWVLGEFSRDLDIPVREVPPKAAPVLLGKELASLTRTEVGPVSANAILNRMLTRQKRTVRDVALADGVSAVPADWLRTWVDGFPPGSVIGPLTPILLSARLRKDDEANWIAGVARDGRITVDVRCTGLELATQTYCECLLVKAVAMGAGKE